MLPEVTTFQSTDELNIYTTFISFQLRSCLHLINSTSDVWDCRQISLITQINIYSSRNQEGVKLTLQAPTLPNGHIQTIRRQFADE